MNSLKPEKYTESDMKEWAYLTLGLMRRGIAPLTVLGVFIIGWSSLLLMIQEWVSGLLKGNGIALDLIVAPFCFALSCVLVSICSFRTVTDRLFHALDEGKSLSPSKLYLDNFTAPSARHNWLWHLRSDLKVMKFLTLAAICFMALMTVIGLVIIAGVIGLEWLLGPASNTPSGGPLVIKPPMGPEYTAYGLMLVDLSSFLFFANFINILGRPWLEFSLGNVFGIKYWPNVLRNFPNLISILGLSRQMLHNFLGGGMDTKSSAMPLSIYAAASSFLMLTFMNFADTMKNEVMLSLIVLLQVASMMFWSGYCYVACRHVYMKKKENSPKKVTSAAPHLV
ncbi:hypothetical protein [Neptuniibacter sp. QD37_11]|uniref:hypothetical protein n=1 Tax=Neptuniibacter sp. QD37_11 TaxID=3398209 RepID=UPI0039F5D1E5